ncbi:hypothetical protein PWF76_09250 [Streptococcus suis]|uniref:hypothetical protein n=1 Tax=Streptococcus suis TaxID=1307 RepID=UPI00237CE4F2|nr:hypothetical protein [Streptococcus suis]MDE1692868.1 hypothetical protein [Streptococcus suis]
MTEEMCIKCGKDRTWFLSQYCFSCMNEENEKKLTNDILSGEVEETECEDDIVCPWCGTRYDSFDVDENHLFMDESEHTTDCYECGHDFTYQANVSITFSTKRLEETDE